MKDCWHILLTAIRHRIDAERDISHSPRRFFLRRWWARMRMSWLCAWQEALTHYPQGVSDPMHHALFFWRPSSVKLWLLTLIDGLFYHFRKQVRAAMISSTKELAVARVALEKYGKARHWGKFAEDRLPHFHTHDDWVIYLKLNDETQWQHARNTIIEESMASQGQYTWLGLGDQSDSLRKRRRLLYYARLKLEWEKLNNYVLRRRAAQEAQQDFPAFEDEQSLSFLEEIAFVIAQAKATGDQARGLQELTQALTAMNALLLSISHHAPSVIAPSVVRVLSACEENRWTPAEINAFMVKYQALEKEKTRLLADCNADMSLLRIYQNTELADQLNQIRDTLELSFLRLFAGGQLIAMLRYSSLTVSDKQRWIRCWTLATSVWEAALSQYHACRAENITLKLAEYQTRLQSAVVLSDSAVQAAGSEPQANQDDAHPPTDNNPTVAVEMNWKTLCKTWEIPIMAGHVSLQAVKLRRRELAVELHPDRNPGPDSQVRFVEMMEDLNYLIEAINLSAGKRTGRSNHIECEDLEANRAQVLAKRNSDRMANLAERDAQYAREIRAMLAKNPEYLARFEAVRAGYEGISQACAEISQACAEISGGYKEISRICDEENERAERILERSRAFRAWAAAVSDKQQEWAKLREQRKQLEEKCNADIAILNQQGKTNLASVLVSLSSQLRGIFYGAFCIEGALLINFAAHSQGEKFEPWKEQWEAAKSAWQAQLAIFQQALQDQGIAPALLACAQATANPPARLSRSPSAPMVFGAYPQTLFQRATHTTLESARTRSQSVNDLKVLKNDRFL